MYRDGGRKFTGTGLKWGFEQSSCACFSNRGQLISQVYFSRVPPPLFFFFYQGFSWSVQGEGHPSWWWKPLCFLDGAVHSALQQSPQACQQSITTHFCKYSSSVLHFPHPGGRSECSYTSAFSVLSHFHWSSWHLAEWVQCNCVCAFL